MLLGDTPLIDAARHGRAAGVAALLADGADVNEPKTDGSGATALYATCQEGHTEVVLMERFAPMAGKEADGSQKHYSVKEFEEAMTTVLLGVSRVVGLEEPIKEEDSLMGDAANSASGWRSETYLCSKEVKDEVARLCASTTAQSKNDPEDMTDLFILSTALVLTGKGKMNELFPRAL